MWFTGRYGASAFFLFLPCCFGPVGFLFFFHPHRIRCGRAVLPGLLFTWGGHLCFVGAALHARACCVALSCVILLRPFTSFTIRYPPLRTRFAAADRDSSTSSVVFCAVFFSGGVFSSCLFLLPFALFFFRLGDTKDVHDRLSALSLALEEGGEVAR